jgi:hypothetical protein
MSDTSDNVQQTLLDEIRALRIEVDRLRNPEDPTPHREDRPSTQFVVIPEQLEAICPSITGAHFFRAPADPDEDTILTEAINFPKNRGQQYSAPGMDLPWPQDAGLYHKFDKTLQHAQEMLAHLTRPLDDFTAEIFASPHADGGTKQAVADFSHVMRSQMAIAARKLTDIRIENYVQAKGLKPAPSEDKGASISQDVITARVKAAEAFADASAPRKNTYTRGGPSGRRPYNRGYRGSYFGHYSQQYQQYQQQQPQQQQQQAQQYSQYQPAAYQQVQQNGHVSHYGDQSQYFHRGGRGRGRGRAQKFQ